MAFELAVGMGHRVENLREAWQAEFNSRGFEVEILPSFDADTWSGGFLPFRLERMPEKYLFGLPKVTQISGFEVDFGPSSAHFRSAMGRPLAEFVMICFGAATLAVVTDGTYRDLQTSESWEGVDALQRAHEEIMNYEPHIDERARKQHLFTKWSDYGG